MTTPPKNAIGKPHLVQATSSPADGNERVTFANLVLAHHLRQRRLSDAAQPDAPDGALTRAAAADKAYQARLAIFQAENGDIARGYWCTNQIAAVAIAEQRVRLPWLQLHRKQTRHHIHAETDWATRDAPELTHQLHKIDDLAVRAGEILRGSAENIVMQLLLAAASYVLSYVDREEGPPREPATIKKIVDRSDADLAQIRQQYGRAAESATRTVYAVGMLSGTVLLAALTGVGGLILSAAGDFGRHPTSTWTILATIAAGGIGAVVSVLLRMARAGFNQDYEVGRQTIRRLAMARPFVGAAFAVMIFLLLKSGLVDIGGLNNKQTIYFYAAVAFLAGFSERWARVTISGVASRDGPPASTQQHHAPRDHELDPSTNGRQSVLPFTIRSARRP
jgi:hypothetical protein